ncbi:hypothetical protein P7K49_012938, partial [Saguinus oedipus]
TDPNFQLALNFAWSNFRCVARRGAARGRVLGHSADPALGSHGAREGDAPGRGAARERVLGHSADSALG